MEEETANGASCKTNSPKVPYRIKCTTKICAIVTIIGLLIFCISITVILTKSVEDVKKKPNIVIIMADDLGSYDLSFKGNNQILTPNIDALGYQGIIYNRYYTANLCSPSRASFLTGKYSIRTGMQHMAIINDEPRSLPLDEKILPQYLKEVGYKTHIVGKWHLGFAKKSFTPTHRGFDSHIGFMGAYIDYFNFSTIVPNIPVPSPPGYDFYCNENVSWDRFGEYATDVLTNEATKIIGAHDPNDGPLFLYLPQAATHSANEYDPLQAVPEDLETVSHIKDTDRRKYAAMVKALDRSVGEVVTALKNKQMLDNTIIVFFSDNGGSSRGFLTTFASNYPFRGQKGGAWEGGVRGAAIAWSPLFNIRHYVSNHLIHITDWLPTLTQLTKVSSVNMNMLDGNDIWSTLSDNKLPIRNEILHIMDPIGGYTSYYKDGWKYVNGTPWYGLYDSWYGDLQFEDSPESSSYADVVMKSKTWQALNPFATRRLMPEDIIAMRKKTKIVCQNRIPASPDCNSLQAPCLFYLDEDPCELSNLAHIRPARMAIIEKRIREFEKEMVPPNNVPQDPAANPALNNGLWTWWLEPITK